MSNAVLQKAQSQDALRDAVFSCTSAIRPLLAFRIGHYPAHNFLVKPVCCRFAQVIGIASDLRNYFPPIYSKSVPARSGCVRCPLVQTGDGITPLKVPSTSWRDVRSVIISVGVPIKPS